MGGGSVGCPARRASRLSTPEPISSSPATAKLPPSICFLTSSLDLASLLEDIGTQENPTLANSVAPSRRRLLTLVAGGVLSPAIGASEALAQVTAFKLPKTTEGVEPFKVSVPQSAINDLKRWLASTRWPERETVGDWSQGVPSGRLRRSAQR